MSDCSVPDIYDTGIDTDATDTTDTTGGGISFDNDGDGFAETTVFDFDSDGVADAFDMIDPTTGAETLVIDVDGDGLVDTVVTDDDGDGTFDQGATDSDGDGVIDSTFDPNTGIETETETTDPFTPTAGDDVHGDPMEAIPYHQAQAGDNDCLPTSVAMVLTEVTGTEVPASDVVDIANELDLLGPDGMSIEGGLALLEHYGVDAEVQTGSLDDLRAMLDADRPVIIGLDADDLYGAGDTPFSDDLVSGHAVVITGIDDEAGLVYINDPGFPDGAGVAIPISDFEDAWQDADHSMIVADAAATDVADTTDTTDTVDTTAGAQTGIGADVDLPNEGRNLWDLVLLPFTLAVN